MFCEKCGHKLNNERFCSNCGQEAHHANIKVEIFSNPVSQEKWYLRLAKVAYIVLYIPLPFAIWGVWTSNDPYSYYSSYSREWISYGSYGEAFWYSLLTLIIWIVILRLLKIAVLYIVAGKKPTWSSEFKKLF
jgi:hypothetical protein